MYVSKASTIKSGLTLKHENSVKFFQISTSSLSNTALTLFFLWLKQIDEVQTVCSLHSVLIPVKIRGKTELLETLKNNSTENIQVIFPEQKGRIYAFIIFKKLILAQTPCY